MQRARIIPVLLLQDFGLVKTTLFKNPKYIGDPINAVRIFNDKFTDEIVFLDIMSTRQKRKPNISLIKEICSEAFMPFAYGGGINDLRDIDNLFKIGIEKVVINTAFFKNPNLISKAAEIYGSQSIVVSMDVRKNFFGGETVYTHCGRFNTKYNPVTYAQRAVDYGAGEIICNSIEYDGTMGGYNFKLIERVSSCVNIPLVALGGASSLEDMKKAITISGASAAAAGSYFVFNGPHRAVLISYPSEKEIENLLK